MVVERKGPARRSLCCLLSWEQRPQPSPGQMRRSQVPSSQKWSSQAKSGPPLLSQGLPAHITALMVA